jgi:sarcosine oxidase
VAGTAAALELARAAAEEGSGARTVLLEAREVASAEGSSHGDSRMYRRMYSQEYFSEMQRRALELWSDLESALPPGEGPLLREHGLLFYGDTDTGETVEGSVPGVRATMERLGLAHEWLEGPEALEARWGAAGMRCRPGDAGVFEPGAGSIRASDACRAMAGLASAAGASVIEGEAAVSVSRSGVEGEVEVVTSQGRVFRTPSLVLAAGAWTNEVLEPLGAEFELEVHRVHWGHYRVAAGLEAAAAMPQWFCFRKAKGRDGGLYYGFPPEHDCPNGDLVKVGVDFTPREPGHVEASMAGFRRGADPGVAEMMDAFLAEHWTGAELERVDLQCSPYTMTRDGAFVLDRLPGCPEVVVFTGGSGRAFKFGPLLGRLMAELARGVEPSFDLAPLSALREGVLRSPAAAASAPLYESQGT